MVLGVSVLCVGGLGRTHCEIFALDGQGKRGAVGWRDGLLLRLVGHFLLTFYFSTWIYLVVVLE